MIGWVDIQNIYSTKVEENSASFDYSPKNPMVNEKIKFCACNDDLKFYEWNFGDGEVSNNNGLTTTHSYSKPGEYTVTLELKEKDLVEKKREIAIYVRDTRPIVHGIILAVRGLKHNIIRIKNLFLFIFSKPEKYERRRIKTIWFNAWEYAKEDVIWTALIQSILNNMLKKEKDETREIKELAKIVSTIVLDEVIKKISSGKLSFSDINKYINKYSKMYKDKVTNIESLKQKFENAVEDCVGRDGRLVVFIDDLDRCLPEKSIEILEAIKLFVGAKRCIFLVAVDEEVVQKGIMARYKANRNEEPLIKGSDYLRKIINIPFYIPSPQINKLQDYIIGLTKELTENKDEDKEIIEKVGKVLKDDEIIENIKDGIGPKPRKIKRFLNMYYLLTKLKYKRRLKAIDDKLLAKFVIISVGWDDFYKDIINYFLDTEKNLIKEFYDAITYVKKLEESDIGTQYLKKYVNNREYFSIRKYLRKYLKKDPSLKDKDIAPYVHLSVKLDPLDMVKKIISNECKGVQHVEERLNWLSEDPNEEVRIYTVEAVVVCYKSLKNPKTILDSLKNDVDKIVTFGNYIKRSNADIIVELVKEDKPEDFRKKVLNAFFRKYKDIKMAEDILVDILNISMKVRKEVVDALDMAPVEVRKEVVNAFFKNYKEIVKAEDILVDI
ncbi:MAG: P-loop NTPase fold protein, partial [Methanosarcinales archaeon]